MTEVVFVILIGLFGGIAVGLQGPLVGAMGQVVGPAASTLIVHISGTLLAALLVFARSGEEIAQWRTLPWYMLLTGVCGVILFLTINLTLPRFGAATALLLIIAGQIVTGIVIDHFGLFGVTRQPIDGARVLGLLLLLASGYLINR